MKPLAVPSFCIARLEPGPFSPSRDWWSTFAPDFGSVPTEVLPDDVDVVWEKDTGTLLSGRVCRLYLLRSALYYISTTGHHADNYTLMESLEDRLFETEWGTVLGALGFEWQIGLPRIRRRIRLLQATQSWWQHLKFRLRESDTRPFLIATAGQALWCPLMLTAGTPEVTEQSLKELARSLGSGALVDHDAIFELLKRIRDEESQRRVSTLSDDRIAAALYPLPPELLYSIVSASRSEAVSFLAHIGDHFFGQWKHLAQDHWDFVNSTAGGP